jgi:GTP-binding nuclear protein Ran
LAKSKFNNEKLLLLLAWKMAEDNSLHFVETPAPEYQFDETLKNQYEQELSAAAAQLLPEDDDEYLQPRSLSPHGYLVAKKVTPFWKKV